MARSANGSPVSKVKSTNRKPVRPAAAKAAVPVEAPMRRTSGRPAKAASADPLPKTAKTNKLAVQAPAVTASLKVSKDELRAQVGKLEQLVATFRTKSRETNKIAKAAAARLSELEAQVAQLEKQAAATAASPRQAGPATPSRARRPPRERDPGDAVPTGVAVQEPAPLDEAAESALEHLEQHLGHS